MKKKLLIVGIILIGLLGVTYAWFSFYQEGKNQALVAADLYFRLDSQSNAISLTNVFPESNEEARNHQTEDNSVTFSLVGKNEIDKPIYYEIVLNYGDEKNDLERFNDEDLRFDLIEIQNNEENLLLDAVGFDEINNTKIWVDKVDANERVN